MQDLRSGFGVLRECTI